MDPKNYLLLARTNTGMITEKVCVKAEFEYAKQFLFSILESSKSNTRGEIIEGNRDFIGDFRVKPLYFVQRRADGSYENQ